MRQRGHRDMKALLAALQVAGSCQSDAGTELKAG